MASVIASASAFGNRRRDKPKAEVTVTVLGRGGFPWQRRFVFFSRLEISSATLSA
jgi:hypothetical protein